MTLHKNDIIEVKETNKTGLILTKTSLSYRKNKIIYECLVDGQICYFWKDQIIKLTQKIKDIRR